MSVTVINGCDFSAPTGTVDAGTSQTVRADVHLWNGSSDTREVSVALYAQGRTVSTRTVTLGGSAGKWVGLAGSHTFSGSGTAPVTADIIADKTVVSGGSSGGGTTDPACDVDACRIGGVWCQYCPDGCACAQSFTGTGILGVGESDGYGTPAPKTSHPQYRASAPTGRER